MKTLHTPAPWIFKLEDGDREIHANGKVIMNDMQYYPWCPDNIADWRLIAAAPELLEALIRAMPILESANSKCANETAFIKSMRLVIAKATGGAV